MRRLPDHVTIAMAHELKRLGIVSFNGLFEATYKKLQEWHLVSGGEEMTRLRAFEKLQIMVTQGLVRKIGKEYEPTAKLRDTFPDVREVVTSPTKKKLAQNLYDLAFAAVKGKGSNAEFPIEAAEKIIEEVERVTAPLESRTIYYPYNESFKTYGPPRAGKRAQEYVDAQNELKGGHWVIHTKEQYDEWYRSHGSHLDHIHFLDQ